MIMSSVSKAVLFLPLQFYAFYFIFLFGSPLVKVSKACTRSGEMGILALILISWEKCFNLSPLSMLLTKGVFYKVEEVSPLYRVC